VASDKEYKDLPTYMCQLHDYYSFDTTSKAGYNGFEVVILPGLIFHQNEETKHYVEYEALFQLYQRRDLNTQMMMLWTM